MSREELDQYVLRTVEETDRLARALVIEGTAVELEPTAPLPTVAQRIENPALRGGIFD